MRTVIYSMSVSLDGFIAGPDGDIGWTAPDQELFRFHVEQTREVSAHLCGRGLYETMLVWETAEAPRFGPDELEFARIWKAIPKVVFSTTLEQVQGNARWPAAMSPARWPSSRKRRARAWWPWAARAWPPP